MCHCLSLLYDYFYVIKIQICTKELIMKKDKVEEYQTFRHPQNGEEIIGTRLLTGAIIEAKDMYSAYRGGWRSCEDRIGTTVGYDNAVIYVRPKPRQL